MKLRWVARWVASWFYKPCRMCWRKPANVGCFGDDGAKELCFKHHPLAFIVAIEQEFGRR